MRIWKMLGLVALLAVIICGCVAMGKRDGASAEEQTEEPAASETAAPATETEPENETTESGTAAAPKLYSEGLRYRSNGDGTCAVAGTGNCTAAAVLIPPQSPTGDTVTEILPYAFADSIIGAIEIPTTVTVLSAASFARCRRLAYIRVAAGNSAFAEMDGVLYTADGTVLLYCPPERNSGALTLSATLRRIAAGAFAECGTLQTVMYDGTAAAWHTVIVGDDNAPLYAAGFKFLK